MKSKGVGIFCAGVALSICVALSGCSTSTLAQQQEAIQKEIEAGNTQQAITDILRADAVYPSQLDSSLYTFLLQQSDPVSQQDGVTTAYRVLAQRNALPQEQWLAAAQYFIGTGETRLARDLLEQAALQSDDEATLALLNEQVVSPEDEPEALQALLKQAASALESGQMPDLIALVQSTEWLNQGLSAVEGGVRQYRFEQEGKRFYMRAYAENGVPVFCAWQYGEGDDVVAVCVTPDAVTRLQASLAGDAYDGAFVADYLDVSGGAFYTITGTLQRGALHGDVTFSRAEVALEQTAAQAWTQGEEAEKEAYSGTFENGQLAQEAPEQTQDAFVAGYNAEKTKCLLLARPADAAPEDGVQIGWLPVADAIGW